MSEAQAIALRYPALLDSECAHPQFGHVLPLGSLVLTVNAGFE